jgi:tRNA(adenine34) deaminase
MINQDEFFMNMALEQAKLAWDVYNEVPIGAVIVRNNQIIAAGSNLSLTNVDPTAHAEIIAIRKAAQSIGNYRLSAVDLYVTLEPCPMCFGAIMHARIKKLVYGAKDPKFGALGSIVNLSNYKWNHKFTYQGGILEQDCAGILKEFFKQKRD